MLKKQIVGSEGNPILPGQTHEAYLQIEKTLKSLNLDPHDNMSKLIKDGFFTQGVKDHFEKGLRNFIVGEVIRHRDGNCVPQDLGDNYKKWFVTPNLKLKIAIRENLPPLTEYVLPKAMWDREIQAECKSIPMEEETWLLIHFLLIIMPELGKKILNYELKKDKWYVFHVKRADGTVVAVSVYWRGGAWLVDAYDFDDWDRWGAGGVFLFFATAKK